MMILISAFLTFISVTGLVWYFGNGFLEKQIVEERMKRFTRPFGSQRLKDGILKTEFNAKKSFKRSFDMGAVKFENIASYLVVWIGISFFLVFKVNAPPFFKFLFIVIFPLWVMQILKWTAKRRRRARIEKELPGTLDLIVICLEAGLGINAAFLRVSNEMENSPLGDDLKQTFNEVSAGVPLDQALRNFARRAAIPDLNAIVVAVIQAQKMGTAVAMTFRVQAESLREQYKMRMKEKIMKAPVKVLFPLVFFIFPALFIVILGPAMISIFNQFVQNNPITQ